MAYQQSTKGGWQSVKRTFQPNNHKRKKGIKKTQKKQEPYKFNDLIPNWWYENENKH